MLTFALRRRRLLAALATAGIAPSLLGQGSRGSIRLIVPAPAGGSADALGRLVADALSGILEVQVRVENEPGDGGVTGTNLIARSPRDGSVIGVAVSSALVAQAFKVAGVLDVSVCNIGTAPAPGSSATIAIALREIAKYDTSRITVSSSSATP